MAEFAQLDLKGLDMMYQLYENICENHLSEIRKMEDKTSVPYQEKIGQFMYQLQQFQFVIEEINTRRKASLLFSVEDIYKFNGQSDKYSIFRFYKTSDAYKKYGDDAFGHLIYSKKQREKLEEKITQEKYDRTDDKIFLDAASKDKGKIDLLRTEGFLASDVLEILTFTHDNSKGKQYKKEGLKEIPNTINVKFDSQDMDLEKLVIWNMNQKIKGGYTLLRHDWVTYYANIFVVNPDLISDEIKTKYLLKEDKSGFQEEADIKINAGRLRRMLSTGEEIFYFDKLLKERRIARFEIIKNELGISDKQIEKFREANPEQFEQLHVIVLQFDTETISDYKTDYPIYWDFERFAHIFLRHYKEFFINGTSARGTHFQYVYKDIRRIARLIIENLRGEIEESLASGMPYAKYGDQGYYFNGNFYTLRISAEGKLMQFHPQE
jgi:hypothetical protein